MGHLGGGWLGANFPKRVGAYKPKPGYGRLRADIGSAADPPDFRLVGGTPTVVLVK